MARSAAATSSRKPGQERGQALAVQTTGDITAVGAYLTVKLSYGPEQETSHDWQQPSDESCLAADLIATSGGASVDTRGPCLLARFPTVQSAALAARRLQWASQGFRDSSDHPAEFCILLQSGEESKGEIDERFAWHVFEGASPGQILLSEAAAKALEPVPAFLLEPGAHGDLCGLKWRAPDDQTTRKADEAAIARLIGLYNRSESPAEAFEPADSIAGHDQDLGAGGASAGSGMRPTAHDRRTIFWIGGFAAAAILAVVAVIFLKHEGPVARQAQAVSNQSAVVANTNQPANRIPVTPIVQQQAVSDQPSPQVHAQPAVQRPVEPSARDKKRGKQAQTPATKAEAETTAEAPESRKPEQPRAGCEFPPEEIPSLLGQAENLRARRQYPAARRKFTEVLACEPSNVRAKEGLNQVKQAMEADQ
jgi:hypothetical protein